MSIVTDIEKTFFEIESFFNKKIFESRLAGDTAKELYWENGLDLNTHAYFVLLFARFEDHIKTETKKLILQSKSNIANYAERAAWEIIDTKQIHFKKRVELFIEKANPDYSTIIKYYEHRNTIAHGGTIANIRDIHNGIDMIAAFSNMERFFIQFTV
jgi:hypothetical protein